MLGVHECDFMEGIEYKLKKYEKRVPGEMWSKESKKKSEKLIKKLDYLDVAEVVMDELKIKGKRRDEVKDIIMKIPLNKLHGKLKSDKIIIAICFFVKRKDRKNAVLEDYSICKHNLEYKELSIIMMNLSSYAMSRSGLRGTSDFGYDPELYSEVET